MQEVYLRCHDAVPSHTPVCEQGCITGSAPTAFVASPQCFRRCCFVSLLVSEEDGIPAQLCLHGRLICLDCCMHAPPPPPPGLHSIQSPSGCAAVDHDKARCEYQDHEARDYVKAELAAAAALQVIIRGAALPCGFSAEVDLCRTVDDNYDTYRMACDSSDGLPRSPPSAQQWSTANYIALWAAHKRGHNVR